MSVAIVGAGPGDPGLITVRGLELVEAADVLVYDRLVSSELVAKAVGADLIPRDDLTQRQVNEVLIHEGARGLAVVRLKGGDPFVFGRGGEEAVALAEAGVDFEVVPGLSTLTALPALAGIPLTHRGISAQVTVVTGTAGDGGELDYVRLAATPGTLDDLHGPPASRADRGPADLPREAVRRAGGRHLEGLTAGFSGRRRHAGLDRGRGCAPRVAGGCRRRRCRGARARRS